MMNSFLTNKTFPIIIGITALIIALCSAFFSVYGIGNLFAGASIAAMVMASSLELGKLVATTFIYRYWSKSIGLIKTYLIVAIVVLTVITSAGIFGFLSSAYQKSSLDFKLSQEKIGLVENSKSFYINQIKSSEVRIQTLNDIRKVQEGRLSDALTNTFLVRNPIQLQQIQQQTIKSVDQANSDIKSENDKIEQCRVKLQDIDESINKIKIGSSEKKDIQTFKFLADALHTDLDTVAKWFIVLLIAVFDPLALTLVIAYNISISEKEDSITPKIIISPTPRDEVESDNVLKSEDKLNNVDPIVSNNVTSEEMPSEISVPIPIIQSQHQPPMDDFFKRMFKH